MYMYIQHVFSIVVQRRTEGKRINKYRLEGKRKVSKEVSNEKRKEVGSRKQGKYKQGIDRKRLLLFSVRGLVGMIQTHVV